MCVVYLTLISNDIIPKSLQNLTYKNVNSLKIQFFFPVQINQKKQKKILFLSSNYLGVPSGIIFKAWYQGSWKRLRSSSSGVRLRPFLEILPVRRRN